ncbi:hypothetical protein [Methylocystis sp. B8]|uniref:hypothetical protein n=1 Tax=Methylocystis sp. B8 TaxID=544938 RepID=UPI0010FE7337|nr:hypothetical protein [Methylocystis sp. B8]TLG79161.1 hypothetical protein FEV16_03885 [Methylocystis sp. B8]
MGDHLEAKFAAVSARSRRLLVDAAVCFVATWLVAFLPAQWKNADVLNEIVFTTDPVSGKIIDRIETADTERASAGRKSGAPALFAIYPQERISDWSNEYDPPNEPVAEKTEASLIKPTKVAALRKPSPEKRNPVGSPLAPPTNNAEPVAAQTMGDSADQPDRSLLAKLDPTGLSSKLAPLGLKAWNGATSLTGAVSSLVNAYRF